MFKILFTLSFLFTLNVQAAELRLLSWNIFMIPKPINFSLQQKRAVEIGKVLKNSKYHVVVMQEAFSEPARRKIFKAAREIFPYQYYSRSKRGGSKVAVLPSGTWILSRYPIKTLGAHIFSQCTTSDCLADKAVVVQELKLPNSRRFQIAHTHLQAWNTEKARAVRATQLAEIKDMLNKYHQAGVPQILAGDLNVDFYNKDEFSQMLSILDVDHTPLSGELQISNGFAVDCYNIPAGEAGGEWLDHILLFPNATEARIKSQQILSFKGMIKKRQCDLSDHYAIESRIEI
jgi:endonuclease/exonuclease/phosphatase family metal-dependent hydrolase